MTGSLRIIAFTAWGVLAFVVLAIGLGATGIIQSLSQAPSEQAAGAPAIGGPFELTSHTGETITNADLAGSPYLVFFGFTHCPDVCPTTLAQITALLERLGSEAVLTPLFITVDPERDTQEVMADYVGYFDERILGLRGTPEQTEQAVESFAAYYEKVPLDGGGYTMDHTASVLMMDRQGEFAGTLDIHEPMDTQLEKLRRLMQTTEDGRST